MTTKDITLPSGLVVKIKKPGVLALHAVYGVLPSVAGEAGMEQPARPAESLEATIKLVSRWCGEPRGSDADPPPAGSEAVADQLHGTQAFSEQLARQWEHPVSPHRAEAYLATTDQSFNPTDLRFG